MLGCVFQKGMLGFQTASGKETVYFAKSNVCVGNVRPLFNWSWEINPHHPVCESGTAVKSPKKTSYLVKQRKLVMVSAIECHSAVDHHFWCRSPLTSCGKALSSQHTHTTLQQVAGRCLVSFLRGWNTVCVQMLSPKLSSYRWKNNTFAQLGLPAGSEAWQRNLTHLHGSLYRWCFHNYP